MRDKVILTIIYWRIAEIYKENSPRKQNDALIEFIIGQDKSFTNLQATGANLCIACYTYLSAMGD